VTSKPTPRLAMTTSAQALEAEVRGTRHTEQKEASSFMNEPITICTGDVRSCADQSAKV